MKLRILAPVLFLATGACFATRNDVLILQGNLQKSDSLTQARLARLDSLQAVRFSELTRNFRTFLDSAINALNNQVNNSSGSITTEQRSLGTNVEQILAQLQLFSGELKRLSDENARTREQMAALALSVAAQDSTRPLPGDGPVAKLLAGKQLLESASYGVARDLFIEVIGEATDTAVLAEAHKHLADAYIGDNQLASADSVFKQLYEKYPDNVHAPEALFRRGVILVNAKQLVEARAIFNRVIERYPGTTYVQMARDRLKEIIPPSRN